jgi:hypothetical protein
MEDKKIMVGKNIYSELRKNNRTVWGVILVSVVSIVSMLYFALYVYQDAGSKLYTINNKGDLIPLSLVDGKKDKVKQVQGATEFFVRQFFDLDQYSINDKKENVLWLVGEQPTKVIKDKANKGYYSNFMTINGLVQKVEIMNDTWSISDIDSNPNVSVSLLVKRINGNNQEFFKADINLRMAKTTINYPYNPFGFLITNYTETLSKVIAPTEEEIIIQDSLKVNNKPNVN